MKGDECLDCLDVKNGLVHVAEQGLVANILNPTSPLLQVVPEIMERAKRIISATDSNYFKLKIKSIERDILAFLQSVVTPCNKLNIGFW